MESDGMILDDLTKIRDELYESLPTGKVDTFSLITAIKKHIEKLDKIIEEYQK